MTFAIFIHAIINFFVGWVFPPMGVWKFLDWNRDTFGRRWAYIVCIFLMVVCVLGLIFKTVT